MKKIILYISFIILVSCNQNKSDSILHYKTALKEYKNKEYLKASKEIDFSIKLDSTNNDKFLLKGRILSKLELYTQSNSVLKYLLKANYKKDTINFELSENYFGIAKSYYSKNKNEVEMVNNYEKSISYIENAIKLNVTYQEAYELKEKILFNNNRFEEAMSHINHAVELFPNNFLFIGMRGNVKYQLGDAEGALIDLTKSINSKKLNKFDLSQLLRLRGFIFFNKTRLSEALKDLKQSVLLDPKDEYSFAVLGDIYIALNDKKNACLSYRKSADLGNILAYEQIKELCGVN